MQQLTYLLVNSHLCTSAIQRLEVRLYLFPGHGGDLHGHGGPDHNGKQQQQLHAPSKYKQKWN